MSDHFPPSLQDGDKLINCCDCSAEFVFTLREQDFYASKQLNDPKRCRPCREKKKGTFGKTPRDLHPAICSQCAMNCEVPFQPVSGRPVYCKNCLADKKRNA